MEWEAINNHMHTIFFFFKKEGDIEIKVNKSLSRPLPLLPT